MYKGMRRFLIIILIVLLFGCGKKADQGLQEQVIPVVYQQLKPVIARGTQSFSGVIDADENIIVYGEESGKVISLYVEVGDRVRAGQLLARIDDTKTKANLAQAEANLSLAKVNYDRQLALYNQQVIAKAQFDAAESQYKQAKAQYDFNKKKHDNTYLRSPINGSVGARLIKKGEFFSAGQSGKPAFTIINFDKIIIPLGVSEKYIVKIAKGKEAKVTVDSMPHRTFVGKVSSIGLLADFSTGTFPVKIEVPNKEHVLKAGMIARVEIGTDYFRDATVIPIHALVEKSDKKGVFLLNDVKNMVFFKEVQIGFEFEDKLMIKKGLRFGDKVIVKGQDKIVAGDKVDPKSINEVK